MKLPPLILLHGALGASSQFDVFIEYLHIKFDVHTFDFSGHGSDDYDGILTMEILSNDILEYMDDHGLKRCDIFGYSMGGYAAVQLATEHPDRIGRIMTLGTKWNWNAESATKEVKMHLWHVSLARASLARYAGKFDVQYLVGLTLTEMISAVGELRADAVVLYLTVIPDNTGAPLVPRDVLTRVAAASLLPSSACSKRILAMELSLA